MVDKYIILHGCPASAENIIPPEKRWMNWVADELIKKGFDAVAPAMPTPWKPKYAQWKEEFEKHSPSENSVLVGHSCGGAFLVKWLLETGVRVKKLILVAPAKIDPLEGNPRAELYDFEFSEDAPEIAEEIVLFESNDLPENLQSIELYKQGLKPKVIHVENKVHFLIFTMGTPEFPELLQEMLSSTN